MAQSCQKALHNYMSKVCQVYDENQCLNVRNGWKWVEIISDRVVKRRLPQRAQRKYSTKATKKLYPSWPLCHHFVFFVVNCI